MKFAATVRFFYNFQTQKRIDSAKTIRGNTVCTWMAPKRKSDKERRPACAKC